MTINNQSSNNPTEPTTNSMSATNAHSIESVIDSIQPELVSYRSTRNPLWDIHEFVRRVLSKEAPGFRITVKKNGTKTIEPLALGRWFYPLINHLMARIPLPLPCQPAGFVGLFMDCCIELQLFGNSFGKAGDYHRPGMNGAELFNALLELIRKRARTDRRCKDYLNFGEDYDLDELKSVVTYFDDLFLDYSKILVVRVDLGYQAEEADKITFERAHRDIQRFINYRKWHSCFKHCIGHVIGRERGTNSTEENGGNGRGYHFHCFILFDGQKVKDDVELARKIIDYWENRIVNSPRTPSEERIKTWAFNCNQKARNDGYRYNGIGMVQHSDELKRWHMISALIYLTKNSQALGDDVPPGMRAITKGLHKSKALEMRGRPRLVTVQGERIAVRRGPSSSGDSSLPTYIA
jgi:hypothetical protein